MEAFIVVCQPRWPLRPCHPENLSELRKIATKNEPAVRSWCVCFSPREHLIYVYYSTKRLAGDYLAPPTPPGRKYRLV